MARNAGTVIENNLSRGLITEATGMNFPDNAVTEADNIVFERIGRVRRRLGLDIESSAVTHGYDDEEGIIKEFLWHAVGSQGGVTFLVVQIGSEVHFYEMTTSDTLSTNLRPVFIDLWDFAVPGATDLHLKPVSYASGGGYLILAHPGCDPVMIRWNKDTDYFESARLKIMVRDTWGVDDGLAPTEEPTTLTPQHHYNLKNQSWNRNVRVGSVSNELSGETTPGKNGYIPLTWEQIG